MDSLIGISTLLFPSYSITSSQFKHPSPTRIVENIHMFSHLNYSATCNGFELPVKVAHFSHSFSLYLVSFLDHSSHTKQCILQLLKPFQHLSTLDRIPSTHQYNLCFFNIVHTILLRLITYAFIP